MFKFKDHISPSVVISVAITFFVTLVVATLFYIITNLINDNKRMAEELKSVTEITEINTEQNVASEANSITQDDIQIVDKKVELSDSVIIAKTPNAISASKSETPVVRTPDVNTTDTSESETIEKLIVTNVETVTIGQFTTVSWSTNLNSDSRLILDEDFFVSDSKNSKNHSIQISGLSKSSTYNYEIKASTDNTEISYFGKFSTPLEYDVRLAYSKDPECIVVIVEDTNGTPVPRVNLKITGAYYGGSSRFLSESVQKSTNIHGEVEYCSKINDIKVVDLDGGKVLYNGTVVIY